MKMRFIAAGLLAAFAAAPASASVLFDTLHPTTDIDANSTRVISPGSPSATTGAATLARGGPIAESFDAPSALVISQISLQLTSNTPSDGGSVMVFLVPDTGGSPGVAGSPTYTGTGASLALTGATPLGTISDALLPTTAGGATFTIDPDVAIGAGEYWIALENTPGSVTGTAKWVFDTTAYTAGTGLTGQSIFWQAGPLHTSCAGAPCTFSDASNTSNLYEMEIIATPEPATLALLGAGLAGMGLVRRRRS